MPIVSGNGQIGSSGQGSGGLLNAWRLFGSWLASELPAIAWMLRQISGR